MTNSYLVLLKPAKEPGVIGYTVEVPALPGCITEGDSYEDAIKNAREAIELFIESLRADGIDVPDSDELPVKVEVSTGLEQSA